MSILTKCYLFRWNHMANMSIDTELSSKAVTDRILEELGIKLTELVKQTQGIGKVLDDIISADRFASTDSAEMKRRTTEILQQVIESIFKQYLFLDRDIILQIIKLIESITQLIGAAIKADDEKKFLVQNLQMAQLAELVRFLEMQQILRDLSVLSEKINRLQQELHAVNGKLAHAMFNAYMSLKTPENRYGYIKELNNFRFDRHELIDFVAKVAGEKVLMGMEPMQANREAHREWFDLKIPIEDKVKRDLAADREADKSYNQVSSAIDVRNNTEMKSLLTNRLTDLKRLHQNTTDDYRASSLSNNPYIEKPLQDNLVSPEISQRYQVANGSPSNNQSALLNAQHRSEKKVYFSPMASIVAAPNHVEKKDENPPSPEVKSARSRRI